MTETEHSPQHLADLRKKAELLRRRRDLEKNFGLLFYRPHKKQDMFHRAGEFKFRYLECANRFGKSDSGGAEDCAFALGERPWLPKSDPGRYAGIPQRPNKILVICADWDKVDEIFTGEGKKGGVGKLWKFLPKAKAKAVSRSSTGTIDKIMVESVWGGNSIICFDTRKSFAQNPMGSESDDWDYIHVDEPITEAHWKAVSRGLIDRDGKASFTCTNLDQPWISRFMQVKPKRKEDLAVRVTDGRKSRWALRGSVYDNPYLPPAAIAEFEATLTEDEKQCRLYGIPLHLSGIVYKEFNDQLHVGLPQKPPAGWRNWRTPPSDHTVYTALDTHPNTPHATLAAAVGPDHKVVFFDERFEHESATEIAEYFNRRYAGLNVVSYQLEPGAYVPDPSTKIVFADTLAKFGLPFQKAVKDLKGGILNAKEYLKYNRVLIAPHLERTLWEFENYVWAIKDGIASNKPVDRDDHMMENFYRILLKHPVFQPLADQSMVVEPSEHTSLTAFPEEEDDWAYVTDSLYAF